MRTLENQTDALRLVALVDRLYDAQVRIIATGVPLGVYRSSGFRVRFPIRMTLLNPATVGLLCRGFDRPPLERFGLMIWNYIRFDFGDSFFRNSSVIDLIIAWADPRLGGR